MRCEQRFAGDSGQPGVRCIWASPDDDNRASIAVLKRAGLVPVADESGSRRYEFKDHHAGED